ncbi:hypothetical protein D3C72_2486600 [compost metagenome]
MLGAAAYLGLEQLLSLWTEHWLLAFGPLLLLVVLFGRQGIYGLLMKGADKPRRARARSALPPLAAQEIRP